MKSIGFILFYLFFGNAVSGQYINVNTNYTEQQLVDKFIGAQNAGCIKIYNVTVNGWNFGGNDLSYGYFDKGSSAFPIDEGIILSTGKALAAPGPNDNANRQDNYDPAWGGDSDLEAALIKAGLSTDDIRNATALEFDFESLQSDVISFDYMFLSEEYRTSNCYYSDVFAFLIKKADNSEDYKNIAVIPGTNIPVTSTTVSGANCTGQDGHPQYFGGYNPFNNPTNFNGQTKILKAVTTVEKGVRYHIKLVIADHGDAKGILDSAVFLKSGSFTGNIDIGNDLIVDNADPLCRGAVYTLRPTTPITDPAAEYYWFKDGVPLSVPNTQDYYNVQDEEGEFSLRVQLGTGCQLQGQVKIELAPVAIIDNTPIMICDNDFDGKYIEKLSNFTNQIVTNYGRDFKVEYFTQAGTQINPDNDFEFTQNPQDITVKVGPINCAADTYTLRFYHGSQLQMDYPQQPATIPVFDVCDNELDGTQITNLDDYIGLMTNEAPNPSDVNFYSRETDLLNTQSPIDKSQTLTTSQTEKTFYIRVSKPGNFCDNYSVFKLRFKQPKRSTTISDTIICKGTTINLDAGDGYDAALNLGFSSYKWYRASDPAQTAISTTRYGNNLSAGDYIVELEFNGCIYPQSLKISEPEDLVINNTLIEGSKVTVLAANGIPPYQYSLDGQPFQTNNVFENVPKGQHAISVMDACETVIQNFTIIGIKNVLTPNDDGINDFIDYSDLMGKQNPVFEVYDRNGVMVFKGNTANRYIWDGKLSGKPLETSSYWYILQWDEIGNPNRVQDSGWILLKNRN